MSTPTMKAIPTDYAGCRFRSRLEARWAVVFDHLSMRWEFEPEGLDIDGVRYLPDFYLEQHDLYVEVKGRATATDAKKLVALAGAGRRVVVLGPIPRSDSMGPHFFLFESSDGALHRWNVCLLPDTSGPPNFQPVLWPLRLRLDQISEVQLQGLADHINVFPSMDGFVLASDHVGAGYVAGRSARFEHGECG